MKIGIGISTYNRQDQCMRTIEAIYQHTSTLKSVIVADDGSTDGTPLALSNWMEENRDMLAHQEFSCLGSESNIGICRNKNRLVNGLLADSTIDHIFLIEDDVRPRRPGWEHAFILTSQVNHLDHLLYLPDKKAATDPYMYGKVKLITDNANMPIYWKPFCSAMIMYFSAALLRQIGGFDERFLEYGWEHNELTARALAAQGVLPAFYPHCYTAEREGLICADDMNRNATWAYAEMQKHTRSARKNEPLYKELMKDHLETARRIAAERKAVRVEEL